MTVNVDIPNTITVSAEAPITPLEAASNVAKTILKDWKIDDQIFADFEAKPMKWL